MVIQNRRIKFWRSLVEELSVRAQLSGLEDTQIKIYQQLQYDGAGAVDHHVNRSPGAIRQKSLVQFVATGDDRSAQKSQNGIPKKVGMWQGLPPGMKPRKTDQPIASEVSALANVVVKDLPAGIADMPKDCLIEGAEERGCMV